jgi:hypothetical protein
MSQSENRPEIPPTYTTLNPLGAEATAQVQSGQIAKTMEQAEPKEHNKNRGKVTRRVLIGAASVGVCAGAVKLAPLAVEKAGYYTKQELDQALQNGIAQGREELLAELRDLEGIGLGAAIAIAKITKFAVQYIVKPLADLNSTISGDIIGFLANGVGTALSFLRGIPGFPGDALKALQNLEGLLSGWHQSVSQDVLGQYAVQDVTAAEAYLEALQRKINGQSPKGS